MKKRELFDLSLVVFVSILSSLFSMYINFFDRFDKIIYNYTKLPIAEFLLNIIFLWLAGLLWLTYRNWRKAIKSQKELEDIIGSINPDVLMVIDSNRKIIMCNATVKRIFGYEVKDVINQKPDLLYFDRRSKQSDKHEIHDIIERDGFHMGEATGKKKDGDIIPLEIITAKLSGREGAVLLLKDVSERKNMEQKLFQAEKLKSLGELAGGVAHDFNNVLAAILGNAQLLKMSVDPLADVVEENKIVAELKRGLSVIEKAAKDGAETVKRIQEFAKTRDEDKYFTAVNINEVIADALNFTKMRWKDDAESKGIKINLQKELSPRPSMSGSGVKLREVIVNLINNAIDAMPQGGDIKIKTFSGDGQFCIRVKDTGGGIPSDRKDRIFDPFFTTKGVQSSGLGLSVSYGIINRHRGTISVDSVEGEGTTFTIKLPISDRGIEEEQEKAVQVEHRKAKILVIEDEEQVRDVLSTILIQRGHEVETASSGSQGMELFKKEGFDLVFTDLGMPGMSGWQVAEKVKAIDERVPVALITGWNIELKQSEAKESGADLIIQKPFEVEQVLNLVQEGMVLRDQLKAV